MAFYSDGFLRMIRNEIRIDKVIDVLMLETKFSEKYLRFRCPMCHGFHTATNPKTNLGRCFECKVNFNPIDLVMASTGRDFTDTIEFLKNQIKDPGVSNDV